MASETASNGQATIRVSPDDTLMFDLFQVAGGKIVEPDAVREVLREAERVIHDRDVNLDRLKDMYEYAKQAFVVGEAVFETT